MSAPTTQATFARLTHRETMLALPAPGQAPEPTPPEDRHPRRVLEDLLAAALAQPPCHVLFSGGRDSSALLALAVHVARRTGLPLPVPVTARHPEAPESNENRWQELVLEHLRLQEHVVLEMRGEQHLLGDVATAALRRHGPVWPEAVQLHGAIYSHLDPGVIVTGEGGDMVLTGHRVGSLRTALALQSPRRTNLRAGLRALQPAVVTRRQMLSARAQQFAPPWLRSAATAAYLAQLAEMTVEPWRWDTATRHAAHVRPMAVLVANLDAAITEYGSYPLHPFFDPAFVEALARTAGPLGWGGRTEIFRRLFHDVLPDKVLARRSKAAFNSTRWGPGEREFARSWDGSGVAPDWIDPNALRAAWLNDDPHPAADFLLHVAWAHSEGITPTAGENG